MCDIGAKFKGDRVERLEVLKIRLKVFSLKMSKIILYVKGLMPGQNGGTGSEYTYSRCVYK